ncbi:MAG: alpha/beta hydrolase [Saprospiraceae bacterium]|jgi:pimeloyl-ACP methyl ester carboxylesterase|nr:alpha/beta hydrolase [Saprospiraceae bacterium]
MSKVLKFFKYLLLLIVAIIGIYTAINYHNDISISEMKAKYAYPESKFVEIQNTPVHYRIVGEGMPVVLVHGTAASIHTWEDWTDILKQDFQVISFDLPAFGLTGPRPDRKYAISDYVAFMDEFVENIGVDSFHLAGNSLGGGIAWNYTVAHPEKVAKLILVNSSGYPSNKAPSIAFKIAGTPILKDLMQKITPKSLIEKSLSEVFYNDALVSDEIVNRYFDMTLREGNRQAFGDRVAQVQYNNSDLVKTVQNETLIIWGAHDEWIPVECAHNFHRDLPNSELKIYEKCGHIPMEEKAKESGQDVLTFLNRVNEQITRK